MARKTSKKATKTSKKTKTIKKQQTGLVGLVQWFMQEMGLMVVLIVFSMGMTAFGAGILELRGAQAEQARYEAYVANLESEAVAQGDTYQAGKEDMVVGSLQIGGQDINWSYLLQQRGMWLMGIGIVLFIAGTILLVVG